DRRSARGCRTTGTQLDLDHDLARTDVRRPCAQFEFRSMRRRAEVVHFQRRRDESGCRRLAGLPPLRALDERGGRTHRVAIDEGGNQSAVDEAGHGDMLGTRREAGDGRLTVPDRTDVQPRGIQPSASVAVREIVGIEVLNGGFHGAALPTVMRWPSGVCSANSRMPHGFVSGGIPIDAPRDTSSAYSPSISSTVTYAT